MWVQKGSEKMLPQDKSNSKVLKTIIKRARMSVEDVEKLQYCSNKLGISEADIIRLGIRAIYDDLINKE